MRLFVLYGPPAAGKFTLYTSYPERESLIIDTSRQPPEATARHILQHYNLTRNHRKI